jgi:Tfp pilus assembly protein PilZ
MKKNQTRRKTLRVPVYTVVYLRQSDFNEVGGKMYNLSIGGLGVKTNYPISTGERLALSFHLPNTVGRVNGVGQVVWRQFHGDKPGHRETLFTAGIKFLNIGRSSRKAVHDYVRMSNSSF